MPELHVWDRKRPNKDPPRLFARVDHSGYLQTDEIAKFVGPGAAGNIRVDIEIKLIGSPADASLQCALNRVAADIVGAGVELGLQQRLRMANVILASCWESLRFIGDLFRLPGQLTGEVTTISSMARRTLSHPNRWGSREIASKPGKAGFVFAESAVRPPAIRPGPR